MKSVNGEKIKQIKSYLLEVEPKLAGHWQVMYQLVVCWVNCDKSSLLFVMKGVYVYVYNRSCYQLQIYMRNMFVISYVVVSDGEVLVFLVRIDIKDILGISRNNSNKR